MHPNQNLLFDDGLAPDGAAAGPDAPGRKPARSKAARTDVGPAAPSDALQALAERLPGGLHLGTSSWNFPGWRGLVWDADYPEARLSREGLAAYARHPLLRSVSLDRAFYRPLTASQYAAYAAQVPDEFRFVVKAPSLVADAVVRGEGGAGLQPNPAFLSAELAEQTFIAPVTEGLGAKAGALVFQLSPLPGPMIKRLPEVLERLHAMLRALAPATAALKAVAPDSTLAVEVRNAEWLTQDFAALLRDTGATYCLGLHAKLPPIEAQLPVLRALWPGPLVCRWNLHRKHGAFGYSEAKGLYEPFDQLVDPDPDTRDVLARVIVATAAAGYRAYVTINNKAEGSAPRSVEALALAVMARLMPEGPDGPEGADGPDAPVGPARPEAAAR